MLRRRERDGPKTRDRPFAYGSQAQELDGDLISNTLQLVASDPMDLREVID